MSQDSDGLRIAQYTALRGEIQTRLNTQQVLTGANIAAAGLIIGVVFGQGTSPLVILVAPLLSVLLGAYALHEGLRIFLVCGFQLEEYPELRWDSWATAKMRNLPLIYSAAVRILSFVMVSIVAIAIVGVAGVSPLLAEHLRYGRGEWTLYILIASAEGSATVAIAWGAWYYHRTALSLFRRARTPREKAATP